MNKYRSLDEAISQIFDGATLMVGGFMAVGTPEPVIDAIVKKGVKDLTIVCNDAGYEDRGVGKLIANGQVKRLVASHIGLNPQAGQKMSDGSMDVELIPQGTLAERIRAYGAGLGGFLTPTGIGTMVEGGKEIKTIDGVEYLLELPIRADFAILCADLCDELGNLTYSKTTRNFNPVMAMSAEHVIVYPNKHVKRGEINPEMVVTPHIFVNSIIKEAN